MRTVDSESPGIKGPGNVGRQAIGVTQEGLVKAECFRPGQTLPLVLQPVVDGVDLPAWCHSNREFVETSLLKHGGILFRNFNIGSASEFEQVAKVICPELIDYVEGTSPRLKVSDKVYTSTEFPPKHPIPMHNELSYGHKWPMKIFFFCLKAARQGGETPIVDSRKILELINPDIKNPFMKKQVMYVRNFHSGTGPGMPWQSSFQTTEKSVVENYCRESSINFKWKEGDRLRISEVRPAVARHPKTGDMVWFNQAMLFHPSVLGEDIYRSLLTMTTEDDLPTYAYYGDGSQIEVRGLYEVQRLLQQEAILFPWREGDVLLLDNMLVAHGRLPFEGPRKILVAMGEPMSRKDIAAE